LAGRFHNGVDLPAPAGATVRAVAAGMVVGIHRRGVGGLAVRLRHAPGFETFYAHLGRLTPALAQGKRQVKAGEEIGVIGRSGLTYGTHLFFAIFVQGKAVDPEPYLKLPRCP
jgi:murein DD-endopeptidase MepM/ murein hydrolase activator NlpD